MENHWWILNTKGPVAPGDLKAHLEAERDHYSNTALVAGKDPRDGYPPIKHDGFELIEAQMDLGIAAIVAATATFDKPVHATLRGVLRQETHWSPGDELIISLSIAQVPKPARTG